MALPGCIHRRCHNVEASCSESTWSWGRGVKHSGAANVLGTFVRALPDFLAAPSSDADDASCGCRRRLTLSRMQSIRIRFDILADLAAAGPTTGAQVCVLFPKADQRFAPTGIPADKVKQLKPPALLLAEPSAKSAVLLIVRTPGHISLRLERKKKSSLNGVRSRHFQ